MYLDISQRIGSRQSANGKVENQELQIAGQQGDSGTRDNEVLVEFRDNVESAQARKEQELATLKRRYLLCISEHVLISREQNSLPVWHQKSTVLDVDGADETGDGINLDTKKVLSPEDAATEKQSDNCRKPVAFFETSHH